MGVRRGASTRLLTVLGGTTTILLAAGCQANEPGQGAVASIAATTSSATPTVWQVAPPATGTVQVQATNLTSACLSGDADFTDTATTPQAYEACVTTATRITLRLDPTIGLWETPIPSDPSTVAVKSSSTSQDGTLTAQLVALRPGTSTITTHSGHPGDPQGPPSLTWSLSVTVSR
ncbi:hypothetical protein [Actinokineospora globicatena]|uniref:hypothetical protein n=1 Tax=Actinokineospora globicatena TaxID=103729 RepID=UPI0020A4DFCA|nr:hypothetical protein [Actinokineospora globicatena]MCP2303699.1 hypothetical protein [Actinokineospora globicatena]GLW79163.1 hypothetical protein Aglo01_36450 [Actinokineospora globicatena]GLW86427.1 hypothetical protein Aglo02_40660 [Actinokineospora globicatena]